MRIRVRWWLTAGCDWSSRAQRALTCIRPSWARVSTIFNRDRSARILNRSLSRWMVSFVTFINDGANGAFAVGLRVRVLGLGRVTGALKVDGPPGAVAGGSAATAQLGPNV